MQPFVERHSWRDLAPPRRCLCGYEKLPLVDTGIDVPVRHPDGTWRVYLCRYCVGYAARVAGYEDSNTAELARALSRQRNEQLAARVAGLEAELAEAKSQQAVVVPLEDVKQLLARGTVKRGIRKGFEQAVARPSDPAA